MGLGIAVLGAGRIGRVHCKAVNATAGADLVAIADPMVASAEAAQADFGGEIRDIEAIETSADVQAVIICTPTDTHADLIERFTAAGKDVFCEKPIDLDAARVRRCLDAVAATDRTLMVGFNRRFDPNFVALKARIAAGDIGKVEMVSIISRDPGAPPPAYIERSGGIFRDMTIHDFDIARWLLEEPVETVMATGGVLVDPEIGTLGDYDSASVILRTASGRQATISNSRRASYGYDQRIEVHGSLGTVSAQNLHETSIELATAKGFTRPPLLDFFMDRYAAAYRAEIAAFIAAVQSRDAPPTTGADGLAALLLADAANISVREGRAVSISELGS